MHIVTISDTHLRTPSYLIPPGDLLIHSGDATMGGTLQEVMKFNKWLGEIKDNYKYGIVFVAGNHDWLFEKQPDLARSLITNATYLQDESVVINGFKIYGSPYQPEFCNWAFNLPRGEQLAKKWSQIPDDTNILVTHGPPAKILDTCPGFSQVGCEDLSKRIDQLKDLKLHQFGHIHHSNGMKLHNGIIYINASVCDEKYLPLNPIIEVDL